MTLSSARAPGSSADAAPTHAPVSILDRSSFNSLIVGSVPWRHYNVVPRDERSGNAGELLFQGHEPQKTVFLYSESIA